MTIQRLALILCSLFFAKSVFAELPHCGPHSRFAQAGVIGPDGFIYVTDAAAEKLIRVDPQSGARTALLSRLNAGNQQLGLRDLTFDHNGDILVTRSQSNSLLRVNPRTASYSLVIPNALNASGHTSIVADDVGGFYIGTTSPASIYHVNTINGVTTLISSATTGSGPMFLSPSWLMSSTNGALLIADPGIPAIMAIDPQTGDRAIVSSQNVGGGTVVGRMDTLLERPDGSLLTFSGVADAIVSVAVDSGDRAVYLASPYLAQSNLSVKEILRETATAIEIIAIQPSPTATKIVSLDKTTGAATLITRSGYPDFSSVRADGALFVAMPQLLSVLSVDVATGAYQVVSSETHGTGPLWSNVADLAVGDGNDLLLADPFMETIFRLDAVTGDRTVLSGPAVGSGPALGFMGALAVGGGGIALAYSGSTDSIISVDLSDGSRAVVASDTLGTGPALDTVTAMEFEDANNLLVIESDAKTLLRVNLATGDRQIVSGGGTGSGPQLARPVGLALLPDGRAVVRGEGVWTVDPTDGARTLVRSDSVSTFAPIPHGSLAVLPDGQVLGAGAHELLALFDLLDGSRLLVGDADDDETTEACDNCLGITNVAQVDSNNDGFGNVCDTDLSNDCIVNVLDLGLLRQRFFGTDADADFNLDGVVNAEDLGRLRNAFFGAPGPSGVAHCD